MKRFGTWAAFIASLSVFGILLWVLLKSERSSAEPQGPLLVYCAAGVRIPVEAAAKAYENSTGAKVEIQYGASQTLLANIEVSKQGDLYIPGDESYLAIASQKGLSSESIPVAHMKPVLAVRKGNSKAIRSLDDLLRKDVSVIQAMPDATAVGRSMRAELEASARWEPLAKKTLAFKPTVNDVANDLKIGTADAGFVWDAMVAQNADLEAVQTFERVSKVSASILSTSKQPTAALRFARYLASRTDQFRLAGFQTEECDEWSEEPQLLLYSGAMLRPAIAKTLQAFERREGCRITTVYNGCGILVAQMKAGARPDLYFACDQSFMDDVRDLYLERQTISMNQLVILVKKGNPHGIRSLKDLGKPGLKVGIGHEKQCALGALTQNTLVQSNLREEVMKNVVTQVPAGDLLVNQMRVGALDTAVAYVSNAAGAAEDLDAIPIDIPCALASQPVAIARSSKHKHLGERLMKVLSSPESRRAFEAEGFRWKASP